MKNFPIAVVACNRPEYLKQCLESLKCQVEKRQVFLYIDHPNDESCSKNFQLLQKEYAESVIPGIEVILRNRNYGVGNNMIGVRCDLFEKHKFDSAHIIEDDVILTPYALDTTEHLMHWAEQRFSNVGVTQVWNRRVWDNSELIKLGNAVEFTQSNWICYLMRRWCWEKIAPTMKIYQRSFLTGLQKYRDRDHISIDRWLKYMKDYRLDLKSNEYPENKEMLAKQHKCFVTSQDSATIYGLYINRIARLTTVIPRVKYIGEVGEHCNKHVFNLNKFGEIAAFDDGKPLTKFYPLDVPEVQE